MADKLLDDDDRGEPVSGSGRMSGYGVQYGSSESDFDSDAQSEQEDRRGLRILGVILLVLAVLLILLLKSCGDLTGGGGAGSKAIVPVPDEHPVPGAVSLWIEPTSDVVSVLSAAGVNAINQRGLGEGRWVIEVREGTETQSINALREADHVYDAGLVYTDPIPLEGEKPSSDTPEQ
ncbi:MAG TPA: hypothetical protein VLA05_03615 [Coriobacteriia bacterium]|nr:hypothetical protein [Coriobacteriia bacterium]